MWSELQVLIIQWCHEIVEIPNRDALLSLDVITSFSGATYILDIFFRASVVKAI